MGKVSETLRRILRESMPEVVGGILLAGLLALVAVIRRNASVIASWLWALERWACGILATIPSVWRIVFVTFFVGVIGVLIGLKYIRKKRSASTHRSSGNSSINVLPNSELISQFHFTANQVVASVLSDYSKPINGNLEVQFNALNDTRKATGLLPHYNATRYRIIAPPVVDARSISLVLAPFDFAWTALIQDPSTTDPVRKQLQIQLSQFKRLPLTISSSRHSTFNLRNSSALGVQVCLITSDGKTHLRKRGSNVLFANQRWDVSVSGFCGAADIVDGVLDVSRTVQSEVLREIAPLRGDPRAMIFTGLHHNTRTQAVDILAYWQVETTSDELIQKLVERGKVRPETVFDTQRHAIEPYVWDTRNLISAFDSAQLLDAFRHCDIDLLDFEPQSLLCLELALRWNKQQTLGIKL